ncbi:MAG: hypothetical protein EBU33_02785 [Sphingobacteriia bacterium]|nr:hypothetical protein [Sphingobacteriia bacterium]
MLNVWALKAQTLYWVGGSGNFNDPAHWSLSSGGSANGNLIPSAATDVIFDNQSSAEFVSFPLLAEVKSLKIATQQSLRFEKNPNGWSDSLRNHYYYYPALVPAMSWIDAIAPDQPSILKQSNGLIQVSNTGKETIKAFGVFTLENGTAINLLNAQLVQLIVAEKAALIDLSKVPDINGKRICIASIDRNNLINDNLPIILIDIVIISCKLESEVKTLKVGSPPLFSALYVFSGILVRFGNISNEPEYLVSLPETGSK